MNFTASKKYIAHTLILIGIVFVVGLGAYTRLSQSGLGCPDWPKCYGHWQVHANITTPTLNSDNIDKAWIEMFHRYCAGTLAVVITCYCVLQTIWNKKHWLHPAPIVLLLCFQAMLGMWTVTWKLHPLVVSSHLCGGILLGYWFMKHHGPEHHHSFLPASPELKSIGTIFSSLKYFLWIQIFLGGWTSSQYASLACPDFPFCYPQWTFSWLSFKQAFLSYLPSHLNYEYGILPLASRGLIHMSHRLFAVFIVALSAWLCFKLLRIENSKLRKKAFFTFLPFFLLLSIQISLGIANILFKLPIAIATLHNICALLLLIKHAIIATKLQYAHRLQAQSQPHINDSIAPSYG